MWFNILYIPMIADVAQAHLFSLCSFCGDCQNYWCLLYIYVLEETNVVVTDLMCG